MNIPDFTVVIGVDANHLWQLETSLPTIAKHKPSLFGVNGSRWIVFRDSACDGLGKKVCDVFGKYDLPVECYPWPGKGVVHTGGKGRFQDAQRYKMLSGFVHVPAKAVSTPYWLKLDLDVVASGHDDWIDAGWFSGGPASFGDDGIPPAIIAHPWGYTKPAEQMWMLDRWVDLNKESLPELEDCEPLNLFAKIGATALSHPRIISWCSFYNTEFSRKCSEWAEKTCGPGQLPVRSQDGYHFYCATRLGEKIVTVNMKNRGWRHCSGKNLRQNAEEVL